MSRRRRDDPEGRPGKGEGRGTPGFERVGRVMAAYLERMGLTEAVAGQSVLAKWEAVVGERVARVARASAISGGTLFVRVESSAWLNELNFMRMELLARINAELDGVRVERIVFTLAGESDRRPSHSGGGGEDEGSGPGS